MISPYPQLFKLLKEEFPRLSKKDIDKLITIFLSRCRVCLEEDRSCQCWNDE